MAVFRGRSLTPQKGEVKLRRPGGVPALQPGPGALAAGGSGGGHGRRFGDPYELEGEVAVLKDFERVATLGPGDFFGETGILTGVTLAIARVIGFLRVSDKRSAGAGAVGRGQHLRLVLANKPGGQRRLATR